MCQLLGMNCAAPTDFAFSLKGFCQRGGGTDKHSHGWGTAIYEGRGGLRCFHDTLPACQSPIAKLIQNYRIRTFNMMAHIRYATQGEVSLENVHPFQRELWGIMWTFAHNGEVPLFTNVSDNLPLLGRTTGNDLHFNPIGDTDSEAVFCAILNALKAEFPEGLPTLPVLHEFLSYISKEIVKDHTDETIFNFLLGCGQFTLFAYSWPGARPGSKVWNGLHYIIREPPFSTAKLLDVDYTIDFRTVTTPQDRVAVITTKPLTEEPGWREMERGELIMFNRGKAYTTPKCCEAVEREFGGLFSKTVKKKCTKSPSLVSSCPKTLPVALSLDTSHTRGEPAQQLTVGQVEPQRSWKSPVVSKSLFCFLALAFLIDYATAFLTEHSAPLSRWSSSVRPPRTDVSLVVCDSVRKEGGTTAAAASETTLSVTTATDVLAEWDRLHASGNDQDEESASKDALITQLASAVLHLNDVAAQERQVDSTQGRVMLGICAGSAEEGVATLKAWVTALQLPRGLLHGMDKDGVPLQLDEAAVYIKYNSGGVYTFAEIRKSGLGFDALWKPGDALLEIYDGEYRGVYFQVELADQVFRQFLVPLALFG